MNVITHYWGSFFLSFRFRYQKVCSWVLSFIVCVRFKAISLRKALQSQSMTGVSVRQCGLCLFANTGSDVDMRTHVWRQVLFPVLSLSLSLSYSPPPPTSLIHVPILFIHILFRSRINVTQIPTNRIFTDGNQNRRERQWKMGVVLQWVERKYFLEYNAS
jgi:hypothetical protein